MQVNVTQVTSTLGKSIKKATVIIQGVGMQGRPGKDSVASALPTDGTVGSLLEKTEDGTRWSDTLLNKNIQGGNF